MSRSDNQVISLLHFIRCGFAFFSVNVLLLSTLLLCCSTAIASEEDWLSFAHRDLSGGKKVQLDKFRGKPVVISFFEPDCPWCFKQLKVIKTLHQGCESQFQPIAMGINGTAPNLRSLIARAKPGFPALQASSRFMASIGGVPATPVTVLIGKDSRLSGGWRGYKDKAFLRAAFEKLGVSLACNG